MDIALWYAENEQDEGNPLAARWERIAHRPVKLVGLARTRQCFTVYYYNVSFFKACLEKINQGVVSPQMKQVTSDRAEELC